LFLRYRPAYSADLPHCVRSVRDGFAYADEDLPDLLALWRSLMTGGAATGHVIEDVGAASSDRRIVWFCFKVFVSPDRAGYLKHDGPPLISKNLLEVFRRGETLPVLSHAALSRANAPDGEGVTLVVLNSGYPRFIIEEQRQQEVLDLVTDFSIFSCGGYHLRELLLEAYNDFEHRWGIGAGFRVRTDYGAATFGPDRQPRLMGAIAEEAKALPGTIAAHIFRYTPPRLFFRPAEQDLLLHALIGERDDELADGFCISPNTVKKRWQDIYARVADAAPELLRGETISGSTAGRGAEKRRYLLQYLRHHLEELRPYTVPGPPMGKS
jgi:hypothetical protein